MRRHAVLGLAATLFLAAPAAARAATVDLVPRPPYGGDYKARFVAGPDETNHLKITFDYVGSYQTRVTFHDPGAVIDARSGCVELDAHTARCTDASKVALVGAEARLGNGDDSLTIDNSHGPHFDVGAFGGGGDDTLIGGPEDDEFDGGGGHDHLFGGDGRDTLRDGDRSGAPGDAGPDSDVLDGGPGVDTLSYAGRRRRVTVDLASGAPTGEKGEKDDARGFEDVIGGGGDDRLYGDDGDNELYGGRGDDLLVGRGGCADPAQDSGDLLSGGPGRDRLIGGPGCDILIPGRGEDSLSCGGGFDGVVSPAAGEFLGQQCEQVFYTGEGTDGLGNEGPLSVAFNPHPTKTTRRHVDFAIPCPDDVDGGTVACNGKLKLRMAFGKHRLLGSGSFDRGFFEGGSAIRIRLTRLGRRLIGRSRGVVATAYLRGYSIPHGAWTVRIKR